jgi:hypothetical protein
VTDGSYNREKAKSVSVSGWIGLFIDSLKTLCGLFFEISIKAGSYIAKLLCLVAIHTLALAVAQLFRLDQVAGPIYCGNIALLNQFSKNRKRASTGVKHLDLNRAIQMLKCSNIHVVQI